MECASCSKLFTLKSNLRRHLRTVHNIGDPSQNINRNLNQIDMQFNNYKGTFITGVTKLCIAKISVTWILDILSIKELVLKVVKQEDSLATLMF